MLRSCTNPNAPRRIDHPGDLTPEESFDAYCDHLSTLFDISVLDPASRNKGAAIRVCELGRLLYVDGENHGIGLDRTRRRIESGDIGAVRILTPLTDTSRMLIGDDVLALNSRSIQIVDAARPQKIVSMAHSKYGAIFVPYDMIGYDPSLHPAVVTIKRETPSGRLLGSVLDKSRAHLETAESDEASEMAWMVAACVNGIVNGSGEPRGPHAGKARLAAMKAFIDAHVGQRDLGIEHLQKAFGASRATIFRDFEPDGGVASYIMRRRLVRAFDDLVNTPLRRGRVWEIASKWGFVAQGHFTRRFRAEFGFAPNELHAGFALDELPRKG